MKRRFGLALVTSMVAIGGTAHATTFTVKADPPGAGTSAAPKGHNLTLDVKDIKRGADGNATVATMELVHLLPAEFANQIEKFPTCDGSKVTNENSQPDCPKESILGTGYTVSHLPEARFTAASDRAYIYNLGGGNVRMWVHVSRPAEIAVIINGKIGQAESPFGPTVAWDFRPGANREVGGLEVRVNQFTTTWQLTGSVDPTPPQKPKRPTCTQRARRIQDAKKRRAALARCARSACRAKARKVKNGKRRRAALRRCAKPKKARARARASQSLPPAPFTSTGCATGSWGFQARLSYKDNTNETLDAKVDCISGEGGGGGGGGNPNPLCPPLCATLTGGRR